MTEPTADEAALPFMGFCRGCGKSMISQTAYLALPRDQRAGRPYHLGHRLCGKCYGRAERAGTIPFPAPPRTPRVPRPRARPSAAMEHALRDMRQVGFAQTPKVCKHENGVDEQRVVRAQRGNRTVRQECHECGLHLGYDYPDNPALPTEHELRAFHGRAPWPQPYTWGVARFKRLTAAEWWVYQGVRIKDGKRFHCWIDAYGIEVLLGARDVFTVGFACKASDVVSLRDNIPDRRPRSFLVEIPPAECPQGHALGPNTLIVRLRHPAHRSHTYTCRLCNRVDPHIATWRPAMVPAPTPAMPAAGRSDAIVWRDGSIHLRQDSLSNMALPLAQLALGTLVRG